SLCAEKVDVKPFLQGDIGLLPVGTLAFTATKALGLTFNNHGVNSLDLHFPQFLDSRLDLSLGSILGDLEYKLIVTISNYACLLGHVRRLQYFKNAFLVHASSSSIFLSASTVTTTLS